MDRDTARTAVTWYLDLVREMRLDPGEIHFFGGEPFCAPEMIDFVYYLAKLKAVEAGCSIRFEVATNGVFDEERCRWLADSFDSVVVSLDGPADIQDRHRHYRDGRGSFATVAHNASILSEGTAELSFRACVTADTVRRMPEIAAWLCRTFRPVSVCFEPVQPTPQSERAGLVPPDPWTFADQFVRAARLLEMHGVEPVYAAADIGSRRVSFCPVGQDVAIVSPDGSVSACYLLSRDWEARGLDLRFGRLGEGVVHLDTQAVGAVRELNVWNKPFCDGCFCKWHCAGGCHVNHILPQEPGAYTDLCVQTRIIALRNILSAMGREDLVRALLDDRDALESAVWQPVDRIADARGPV